jgi:hypothetical protein
MNPNDVIQVLGAANAAITLLSGVGLSLAQVAQMQQRAASEGRTTLTPDDLAHLRSEARGALDALGDAIAERAGHEGVPP